MKKKLRQDFTLSRKDTDTAELTWSGVINQRVIGQIQVDGPRMKYLRSFSLPKEGQQLKLQGIPRGTRLVTLRGVPDLWMTAKLDPNGDVRAAFDPQQMGQLQVRILDQHGKPMLDGGVKMVRADAPDAIYGWSPEPLSRQLEVKLPRIDKRVETTLKGVNIMPRASAATYLVSVAKGDSTSKKEWSEPIQVAVVAAQTVQVLAQRQANGSWQLAMEEPTTPPSEKGAP